MGINYQSLLKIIERPADGYAESAEIRNNLPYLVFSAHGYFSDTQLRAMHRNLGHPTVEKQMRTIENAQVEHLSRATRKRLKEIADSCRACQLTLFSVSNNITGEFNRVLQMDVVNLSDSNVLRVICTGTGFQQ